MGDVSSWIDRQGEERLSPVTIQTQTADEEARTCQEAKTGTEMARNETEPNRHGIGSEC